VAAAPDGDWVARFADEVIAAANRYRPHSVRSMRIAAMLNQVVVT